MGWVRRNRRAGAWLAAFALALQLALSFGHLHWHGVALAAPAAPALLGQTSAGDDGLPLPQNRGGAPDICEICATLGLTATSVLPVPASLAPPPRAEMVWAEFASTQAGSALPSFFQARAPPALS